MIDEVMAKVKEAADMRRIRVLRKALDISGVELGRRARVHPADVSSIEMGRKSPPAESPTLRRLARALKWNGEPIALLEECEEAKAGHGTLA